MEEDNQNGYSNNNMPNNMNNNYSNEPSTNNTFQNYNQSQPVNNMNTNFNQSFNPQQTNSYSPESNPVNNQFNAQNAMNQNIPNNNSKKSKLPLIIVLIIILLIVAVIAIVCISSGKKSKVIDTSDNSNSGIAEKENKSTDTNKDELWVKTMDWEKIPEKENDLVLYSSFKAPITIEDFEKHVTDDSFVRYSGSPRSIPIQPNELGTSEELVSGGIITIDGKGDLEFETKRIEEDKKIPLNEILSSGKYWLFESDMADLGTMLGIEKDENIKTDEPYYFTFLVERYGRPNKVIVLSESKNQADFYWKRDGYYFSLHYIDLYIHEKHNFSSFYFSYIPENAWEDHRDLNDHRITVMDFDDYIGSKSKMKKVTGDDSSKYIKTDNTTNNIAEYDKNNYQDDNFRYELNGNEYYIREYLGSDTEVTIPNEVNGKKITRFYLDLPDTVEKMNIGGSWKSFTISGDGLKEINFDEDTYVDLLAIDEYIDCHNLESYYFPKCGRLRGNVEAAFLFQNSAEFHIYFDSVDDIDDLKFGGGHESSKIIFHVKDNPKLYEKLKECGYTVYED